MKKIYENPILKINEFVDVEVLATSGWGFEDYPELPETPIW